MRGTDALGVSVASAFELVDVDKAATGSDGEAEACPLEDVVRGQKYFPGEK